MTVSKVGIIGAGSIGLAYAAWLAHRGHPVSVWQPRKSQCLAHSIELKSTGQLDATVHVQVVSSAQALVADAQVIIFCVPMNAHRATMDAVLPHLSAGQVLIVSSMGSLSSLYLKERCAERGLAVSIASFGTTALTARRTSQNEVRINVRRAKLGVTCLPASDSDAVLKLCTQLFNIPCYTEQNLLVTTLSNTNAISHVPLALLNWTRVERQEHWPQYHYMTPQVASIILQLDRERLALAAAFGVQTQGIEEKLRASSGAQVQALADIAAHIHAQRGGPAGPIEVNTRYITEDVPYGLKFSLALGDLAKVQMPVTRKVTEMAELILAEGDAENDLLKALQLEGETLQGLLQRIQ